MLCLVKVGLAVIIDRMVGDPRLPWPHPVVLIGRLIKWLEKVLHKEKDTPVRLKVKGVVLLLVVVGASSGLSLLLLVLSYRLHRGVGFAVEVWLMSTTLALKELINAGLRVREALTMQDLERARTQVGLIVGRDTKKMGAQEVVRATIESLSENFSDGFVAPLFYLVVGGLPAAIAYKAVNTLDSLVGYRNDRYRDLGWASARADDLLNYLPARLSGFFLALSAPLVKADGVRSFLAMVKFARRHPSPNAGFPEAAAAGGLGIRLGGPLVYQGRLIEKPWLGWDEEKVENQVITVMAKWDKAAATVAAVVLLGAGLLLEMMV